MTSEPTNANPQLLRPHHPVAERVLCPGDPGRALRLAQQLSVDVPAMLNHHRGLWGYACTGADGAALTVQATGVGGPSAVGVVEDLVALGARRIVRVGTARALDPRLAPGALLVADRVLAADGASRALGAGPVVAPDGALTVALGDGADVVGPLVSGDVWPVAGDAAFAGAVAGDLQSAALLAAAARGGARTAVVVVIARGTDGRRADPDVLAAAEERAGRLALHALGPPGPSRG